MNSLVNKPGGFGKLSTLFTHFRTLAGLVAPTLLVLFGPGTARADQPIYSDSLHADWYNWMGGGVADFSNSTPVHSGSNSIAMLDSWSVFIVGRYPPVALTEFASLNFSLHGGGYAQSNMYLVLLFVGSVEPFEATYFPLPVLTPGAWHNVSIPLTSPAFANRTDFQGILIGNFDPAHAPYYVDDIRLTSVPEPPVIGLFGIGWLIAARRFKGVNY